MAYASTPRRGPVEIIGHRGSPREHRENTLPSFRRAFELGVDAVELDVHATSDGVVVVHHDSATNSRSGGSGTIAVIAESSLADLRCIPVGAERIPTLDEVLGTVPADSIVYVEMKAAGIEAEVIASVRSSGRSCPPSSP